MSPAVRVSISLSPEADRSRVHVQRWVSLSPSAKDGNVATGKIHVRWVLTFGSFDKVGFEAGTVLVLFNRQQD